MVSFNPYSIHPGGKSPSPLKYEAGWSLQLVWAIRGGDKTVVAAENRNINPRNASL